MVSIIPLSFLSALLSAKDSDPNPRDRIYYTPLHYAVKERSTEITHLLLEHGADPNAVGKHLNMRTPLHRVRDPNMVDILLQYGADPGIVSKAMSEVCSS